MTDQTIRLVRACAMPVSTDDKFARLRNHAKRAIARSVTSAVRIVIRDSGDLHNISGCVGRAADTVAYGCGTLVISIRCALSPDRPKGRSCTLLHQSSKHASTELRLIDKGRR